MTIAWPEDPPYLRGLTHLDFDVAEAPAGERINIAQVSFEYPWKPLYIVVHPFFCPDEAGFVIQDLIIHLQSQMPMAGTMGAKVSAAVFGEGAPSLILPIVLPRMQVILAVERLARAPGRWKPGGYPRRLSKYSGFSARLYGQPVIRR